MKERKITNKITIPFLIAGLIVNLIIGNYILTLTGFAVAFVSGLIMWLLGGMGGGDVKLMAGIGAWLGTMAFFNILFMGSVIGAIWACINAIKEKRLQAKVAEIAVKMNLIKVLGVKEIVSQKEAAEANCIAFGTCLSIATIIYFITGGVYY